MLFNSFEFIFLFLPLVFFGYFYLNSINKFDMAKLFLVISSLFFYSYWNIKYLPIILVSMGFNYFVSQSLIKNKNKTTLVLGIVCNVALLGYFKYADFFIMNLNMLGANIAQLNILLPLAISFFTFQQIAYLVDSYKGINTHKQSWLDYALFVSFFPQLIAGPIVHHKEMMPQFADSNNKIKIYKNIACGIFIFSIGLFKKVVIADKFAGYATSGFDIAASLNLLEAWATSLSYTIQLYFDFSGYTDMAIGIALMFNIKLPNNFNSPYKALDIQDFWRRWHMTLSRFLKDYVYIPLGGNKNGKLRTYVNLLATFIIGGIWHGAGWTFVFWGFLHGIAIVIHRIWTSFGFKMNKILAWFITFNFVNIAWIFFRANTWDDAIKVLSSMFSLQDVVLAPSMQKYFSFFASNGVRFDEIFIHLNTGHSIIRYILGAIVAALLLKNSIALRENFKPSKFNLVLSIIFFVTSIFSFYRVSEFLYFNF
ncbi:membrane bound O-acyl transferase, MBOAT family [Campylobacter pinnipediorum subsp. caledonicus]|uniref:Membrane bound O-acyl transferase, MBOAT family n=1 Tax=Campylobacter pinnipediorum subsp. caledonicus TaxID=1874362 RepID=A0A1S6U9J0_9BACT|nr:MBOAT family protein [Campylobacter pinnipediorum]AQW88379.1 membrane bound O-acyl transferase, MBOAT family [Campylobacter pinnipediorum subsp. caledonicus]